MDLSALSIEKEFAIKATRAGGKGGQHVNKVSSRIELTFDIPASQVLSEEQKLILLEKLETRLSSEGVLRVTESGDRSQHENREKAIAKTIALLENALKPVKKRKKTKIPKAVKAKIREKKKKLSQKKQRRRENFWD
ncbi:MAG TPA: alternative ribosome rescue aminoacyl-tRNA hydrolase ArfB [Bacteroidia bacterium]|nr:alternative ribosome rescue aminoacyl-tRNA hydrolase ArfB [Bacteroidia bacterium]